MKKALRLLCWLNLHDWRENVRVRGAIWRAHCCMRCGLVEYTGYSDAYGDWETRPYGWHELGSYVVWP